MVLPLVGAAHTGHSAHSRNQPVASAPGAPAAASNRLQHPHRLLNPPKTYMHLQAGSYRSYVRAIGPGTIDQTPASQDFTMRKLMGLTAVFSPDRGAAPAASLPLNTPLPF